MARHRFGDGRYRYFDHPLPERCAAAGEERPTPLILRYGLEGRPRAQSRAHVVTSGSRTALGIIFHDAA